MANEFKIKKGLIVTGADGGTVVDIQGSQGQLFSVTDDLSGSIFAVSDISGVPILDVNSSGLSTFDGNLSISEFIYHTGDIGTSIQMIPGQMVLKNSGGKYINLHSNGIMYFDASAYQFYSGNATFAGDVTVGGGDLNVGSSTTVNSVINMLGTNNSFIEKDTGVDLYFANNVSDRDIKFRVNDDGTNVIALTIDGSEGGDATFAAQAFATTATSSGDASSTLTTKGYVDGLITGATIYRGAWQAGISATSSAATTASTTLTVTAAILDADGETPDLVGAVVTGEGITGIVKVASVTSSTVYVLDTAITATATAYIFSPIYGAPSLDGVTQTSGYYYICSEAGSATPNGADSEPNTWNVGDWCIYNDVSGTGQWQKIDNSSVLSGAGTGQTVALWEGPSSVSDSDTLGNAPITFNGNNATFAGNVLAEGSLITRSVNANVTISGDTSGNIYYNNASGEHRWRANGSSVNSMNLSSSLLTVNENATFTGTISSGRITVSSDAAGDSSWDDSGILIENTSTTTGEPTLAFRNAGTGGTGSNYWFTGLNQTSIYKIAYGTSFTDGNTKLELASNGALRLNAYTQGFLQTDANGNISTSGGGTLPGGPYLPLSAGSGSPLTGTLYIGNVGGDQKIQFQRTGGNVYSIEHDSAQLYFYNRTTTEAPLVIENDGDVLMNAGNVGIGTTTPGSKLELSEVSGAAPTLLTLHQTAVDIVADDTMGSFIDFKSTDINANFTPQARIGMLIRDSNGDNGVISEGCGNLVFHTSRGTDATGAGEDVERMRVTDIGNVGIGTSTPSQKLTIRDDSATVYSTGDAGTNTGDFVLQNNNETNDNFNRISFQSNSDNNETGDLLDAARITAIYPDHAGGNPSGELAFETKADAGSMAEAMRIDRDGNVGIGTDSPSDKLQIQGDGTYISVIAGDGSNAAKLGSDSSGDGLLALYSDAGVNNIKLYGEAASPSYINAGNVGIGETNPDAKLEIAGTEEARYLHVDAIAGFAGISSTMAAMVDFENAGDGNNVKITTNNSVRTDAAPFSVWTNTNSRFIIRNNGSVGIGTAAPRDTLEIVGNMRFVEGEDHLMIKPNSNIHGADFIVGDGVAATDTPVMSLNGLYGGQVTIQTQGNTIADKTVLDVQGTQGQLFSVTDDLSGDIFSVADISGVPIMNVNSDGTSYFDGNVGIGTDSPQVRLTLRREDNGSLFEFNRPASGVEALYGGIVANDPYFYSNNGVFTLGINNPDGGLGGEVSYITMRNGSTRYTTFEAGNVGINTTTPNSGKLVVEGDPYVITNSGKALGGIDLRTNAAVGSGVYGAAISFGTNGSGRAAISSVQGSSDADRQGLVFFTHGSGTGAADSAEAMRISHDGKVGIAENTPSALLDVSDRVYIDTYAAQATGNNAFTSGYLRIRAGSKTGWGVDDQLGKLEFYGTDTSGVGARTAASIIAVCENGNGTSTTTFSSGLSFYTSPYNAAQEERIRITDGGDVGIGTTSPGAKLDVNSSISSSSADVIKLSQNTNGAVKAAASLGLSIQNGGEATNAADLWFTTATNGSLEERMRITSGGNVGINVTNPSDARLKVLGNVIFDGYNTSDPDSTSRTAYPADQMFTHYANNGVSIIGGQGSYTGVGLTIGEETTRSSNFKFIRGVSDTNGGANAAEEFWVNGVGDAYFAGNVGIGTDSPNTPLEVTGGISTTSSDFVIASTGERLLLQTAPSPYSYSKIQATSGGGTMISEVLALQPDGGGVAIGTTSSGADKLLVNGTINFNNNGDKGFVCNPGSGTFSLGDIDDVAGGVYMDGDGVNIKYYAGTAVIGAIDEYGTLTVIGDIVAYGSPSDIRLKENIKPIESALDKVIKLQGVTFDWKESDSILDIKEDIGFIAQDVQKVVPELVRENDNGMLSMRHQGITPILLEAIKELKAEIDLLKSKTCNCNNCNCSI